MYQKKKEFIHKYINSAHENKEKLFIILVMNVKGLTNNFKDYTQSSVISEYYSYSQYEEIYNTIKVNDYSVKCYFDENDFISDYEIGIIRNNYPRKILVINSAQKGIGGEKITYTGLFANYITFCVQAVIPIQLVLHETNFIGTVS